MKPLMNLRMRPGRVYRKKMNKWKGLKKSSRIISSSICWSVPADCIGSLSPLLGPPPSQDPPPPRLDGDSCKVDYIHNEQTHTKTLLYLINNLYRDIRMRTCKSFFTWFSKFLVFGLLAVSFPSCLQFGGCGVTKTEEPNGSNMWRW